MHAHTSIGKLIHHEQLPCYWPSGPGGWRTDRLSGEKDVILSAEELDERFESLVEANDILLERVVGGRDGGMESYNTGSSVISGCVTGRSCRSEETGSTSFTTHHPARTGRCGFTEQDKSM